MTHEDRTHRLLGALPLELKGPVSSFSALVSILERRDDLDRERQKPFLAAMKEEAAKVSEAVVEAEKALPDIRYMRWPLAPVDVMGLVEEALGDDPNLFVALAPPAGKVGSVMVEPFGWLCVMRTALSWVGGKAAPDRPVEIRVDEEDEFVVLTYRLAYADGIAAEDLDALLVEAPGEEPVLMREAVARNRAGLWARKSDGGFEVRLAMAKAAAHAGADSGAPAGTEAAEFYDFDLFLTRRGIEKESRLNAKLRDLEFVVFDTETTGLDVAGGDRMVSISAVRIRGGRVVEAETFNSLVNPAMPIPPKATAIHGIDDLAVADAPGASEVIPKFTDWIGEAVLVAHNASFDARLIARESSRLGLQGPRNTMLDTLMFSYGIYTGGGAHSIEAICGRMGIEAAGRHTSMGDAMATARIFVGMMPLLADRGVTTLAEAKSYCDRMLLKRWQSSRY